MTTEDFDFGNNLSGVSSVSISGYTCACCRLYVLFGQTHTCLGTGVLDSGTFTWPSAPSFAPSVTIALYEYERLKAAETENGKLLQDIDDLERKLANVRDALSEDEAGEDE